MDETTALAKRYADTVVGTPFHPAMTKAAARQGAISAWRDGFNTARSKAAEEEKRQGYIRVANSHGVFTADVYLVDMVISRFLPASANDMRALFRQLGYQEDYSDVHCISEFLVMLAAESPEIVGNPTFRPSWKR